MNTASLKYVIDAQEGQSSFLQFLCHSGLLSEIIGARFLSHLLHITIYTV